MSSLHSHNSTPAPPNPVRASSAAGQNPRPSARASAEEEEVKASGHPTGSSTEEVRDAERELSNTIFQYTAQTVGASDKIAQRLKRQFEEQVQQDTLSLDRMTQEIQGRQIVLTSLSQIVDRPRRQITSALVSQTHNSVVPTAVIARLENERIKHEDQALIHIKEAQYKTVLIKDLIKLDRDVRSFRPAVREDEFDDQLTRIIRETEKLFKEISQSPFFESEPEVEQILRQMITVENEEVTPEQLQERCVDFLTIYCKNGEVPPEQSLIVGEVILKLNNILALMTRNTIPLLISARRFYGTSSNVVQNKYRKEILQQLSICETFMLLITKLLIGHQNSRISSSVSNCVAIVFFYMCYKILNYYSGPSVELVLDLRTFVPYQLLPYLSEIIPQEIEHPLVAFALVCLVGTVVISYNSSWVRRRHGSPPVQRFTGRIAQQQMRQQFTTLFTPVNIAPEELKDDKGGNITPETHQQLERTQRRLMEQRLAESVKQKTDREREQLNQRMVSYYYAPVVPVDTLPPTIQQPMQSALQIKLNREKREERSQKLREKERDRDEGLREQERNIAERLRQDRIELARLGGEQIGDLVSSERKRRAEQLQTENSKRYRQSVAQPGAQAGAESDAQPGAQAGAQAGAESVAQAGAESVAQAGAGAMNFKRNMRKSTRKSAGKKKSTRKSAGKKKSMRKSAGKKKSMRKSAGKKKSMRKSKK
jgi:hypothetical protein